MEYVEVALSFLIGAVLVVFAGFIFSLKTKGLMRILINTVTGGFLLLALSFFTPLNVPLNPLNALLTGFLGIPGVLLVLAIVYLL